MGVDVDQDTWFQPIFNILLQKCFASGALLRTPLGGGITAPQTPGGKRWVTPLQRPPQNCGPQGPETPRSATASHVYVYTRKQTSSILYRAKLDVYIAYDKLVNRNSSISHKNEKNI